MLLFPTTLILLFSSSYGLTEDESVIEREVIDKPWEYYCVDGPFWKEKGLKKDLRYPNLEKYEWCWEHCNEGQDDEYCHFGLCDKVKICRYTPVTWQMGCDKSCDGGVREGIRYKISHLPSFASTGCHIDRSLEDRDNDYQEPAAGYAESRNGMGKWTYEELKKIGWKRFLAKCRSKITYYVPCGYAACSTLLVEPTVNCGSHMEHHCSVCPFGSKGDGGCNGECEWQKRGKMATCVQRKECIGKETQKDMFPKECEDMRKNEEKTFRRYCKYQQIVYNGKTFRELCEKTCLAC